MNKVIYKIIVVCCIVSSPLQATLSREILSQFLLSCAHFHWRYHGNDRGISVEQRIDDLESGRAHLFPQAYTPEINQEQIKTVIAEFVRNVHENPEHIQSFFVCALCIQLFFFIGFITLISFKK